METRTQRVFLKPGQMLTLLLGVSMSAAALAAEGGSPLIEPDLKPKKVDEALIDTENFEMGVFVGAINIEDFESSFLWGGRLTFHLSESFFAESNIGFAKGGATSFEKLAGNVQLLSDADRDYTFYNLNLGYKILPGEAFIGGRYAFNTNFYLLAGAGATEFAGDNRFTVNFGAGYQMLLTDSLSVHLGVRNHQYKIDILGDEKLAINTELSSGISVFF